MGIKEPLINSSVSFRPQGEILYLADFSDLLVPDFLDQSSK